MSLKEIRTDYTKGELTDEFKSKSPFTIFNDWLENAKEAVPLDYNAFALGTSGLDGFPRNRIVLLRGIREDGFIFYTNYSSDKGNEIKADSKVSMNFFWRELEKQIRINGIASPLESSLSDEYFKSRPRKSQIGAWVSNQSRELDSREELVQKEIDLTKKFEGKEVPRPDFWGGYLISPVSMEFWQGRSGRLHDRLLFLNKGENNWQCKRLNP